MFFPSVYWTTPPHIDVNADTRRGAVLLIVLVVLTIFATVGLAFMFYAESEAVSAMAFKDSIDFRSPDVDPELACAHFLQQLIFDCKDDASGFYSALRGHSLLRNMYGFSYNYAPDGKTIALTPNPAAFNGTGRMHYLYGTAPITAADNVTPVTKQIPGGLFNGGDDYQFVNYSFFQSDLPTTLRDPERLGIRQPPVLPTQSRPIPNTNQYMFGANPPYTAADLNCMPLAAMRADGTILLPSYHRDWTGFGPIDPTAANSNWYSPQPDKKYRVLRPRPYDHLGFPPPEDPGGDVRNRPASWPLALIRNSATGVGAQATNDSIWLYTGAPIFTMPDGRRYTFLCAPLIVDLDGKLNLDVAGNIRSYGNKTNPQGGNLGYSPSEMNVGRVLSFTSSPGSPPEWIQLFTGQMSPTQRSYGRYGVPGAVGGSLVNNKLFGPSPTGASVPSPVVSPPHFYAKIDVDGTTGYPQALTLSTAKWNLPGRFQSWPVYPAGFENAAPNELQQHPSYFNTGTTVGDRRLFPASNLNKIYRFGDTNTDQMLCDLWQLLPNNFADIRKRNMITTTSADRIEPGILPWFYNNPSLPQSGGKTAPLMPYTLGAPPNTFKPGALSPLTPVGNPLSSPDPRWFTVANSFRKIGGDFEPPDWRGVVPTSAIASAQTNNVSIRVQLNRPLTPYPVQSLAPQAIISAATMAAPTGQYQQALKDRQNFAIDLYRALIKVTGVWDPYAYSKATNPVMPQPGEADALRYLAQLAVNIVDFIDTDDIMTPFNWGTAGGPDFVTAQSGTSSQFGILSTSWVYGTELPKVVINEAYCQYINTPQTMALAPHKVTQYLVDTWVELCNPLMANDATLVPDGGNVQLSRGVTASQQGAQAYRLLLANQITNIHAPANTDGRPDNNPAANTYVGALIVDPTKAATNNVYGSVSSELSGTNSSNVDASVIKPLNGLFAAPNNRSRNEGFYVIGPKDSTGVPVPFPSNPPIGAGTPVPQATVSAAGMRYTYTINTSVPNDNPQNSPPTVMLQRLAFPYGPYQPDPTNPAYNPYVTVDYFQILPNGVNPAFVYNSISPGQKNTVDFSKFASLGRVEPYIAASAAPFNATPSNPAGPPVAQIGFATNQPKHTFFYHNLNANIVGAGVTIPAFPNPITLAPSVAKAYPPFNWLVHLDRNLISPIELLHVSGYRPHELTQQFNGQFTQLNGTQWLGHQAPWFSNPQRLYRFLEYVQTPPRQTGVTNRIPGKINLNTVWDYEVFQALCDPQTGNHFTDVSGVWKTLLATRNPTGVPSSSDKPILPLSAGIVPANAGDSLYPSGLGIDNTILRSNPNPSSAIPTRLMEPDPPSSANPYQRFELLTKIYNNTTTRSNCFAVWMTVGFFQVMDGSNSDPLHPLGLGPIMGGYLGQELYRTEGKNIRHRMFAIVDRSVIDATTPYPVPGIGSEPFLPVTLNGPSIVQDIHNQKIQFNPHSVTFKDLVPFFTVID